MQRIGFPMLIVAVGFSIAADGRRTPGQEFRPGFASPCRGICSVFSSGSRAFDDKNAITAWGKPVADLQAGIRCSKGMLTIAFGRTTPLAIVIRNVARKPVDVVRYTRPMVTFSRVQGSTVEVTLVPGPMNELMVEKKRLEPGEVLAVGAVSIGHVQPGQEKPAQGSSIQLPPGCYHVGSDDVGLALFNWRVVAPDSGSDKRRQPKLATGHLDVELLPEKQKQDSDQGVRKLKPAADGKDTTDKGQSTLGAKGVPPQQQYSLVPPDKTRRKIPSKPSTPPTPGELVKAATARGGFPPEGHPVLPALSTAMRGWACNEIAESAAIRSAYQKLDVGQRRNVEWFDGVAELEKQRAVACLLSCLCHPSADVQIRALGSLERLKDKRALPFLLLYADYMAVYVAGSENATIHGIIHQSAARTLSTLTGVVVILKGQDPEGLKKGIKQWRKWLVLHEDSPGKEQSKARKETPKQPAKKMSMRSESNPAKRNSFLS